jgi:hypothetical protein
MIAAIRTYYSIPDSTLIELKYQCIRSKKKIGILVNSDVNAFLQTQTYEQDERMRLYLTDIEVNKVETKKKEDEFPSYFM